MRQKKGFKEGSMSLHHSKVTTSNSVAHQFLSHDRGFRSQLEVITRPTKAVATMENLLRPRQKELQGRSCCDIILRSRHEKKTFLIATDNGFRDQEGMLNGLVRSLLGNLRLRQKYKLEIPIEVTTKNSCRDIKLS